jgi:PTS system galactitol-specific IIA component
VNTTTYQLEFYNPIEENNCSKEKILEEMARFLQKKGYVKDTFINAILEREKIFPTGLQTKDINVALPHADAEHVIKPAIVISILKKPIIFNVMGENDKEIPVKIIFMLALNKPHDQLLMLQQLMNLFQKEGSLEKIIQAEDYNTSKTLLEKELINF